MSPTPRLVEYRAAEGTYTIEVEPDVCDHAIRDLISVCRYCGDGIVKEENHERYEGFPE